MPAIIFSAASCIKYADLMTRLEAATSRLEDIATSTELPKDVPPLAQIGSSPPASGTPSAAPVGTPAPAAKAAAEELPERIDDFDSILNGSIANYVKLSTEIGGLVAKQAAFVAKGFQEERKFLLITTKAKKPDTSGADPVYQELLSPINESLMAVNELKDSNRGDPLHTQLSAVADGIMVLAWVTVENKPFAHVEDCLSSAQFFGNRVIKEQKEKYSRSLA